MGDSELREGAVEVVVDGADREHKQLRNLSVGETAGRQRGDLVFATGEWQ